MLVGYARVSTDSDRQSTDLQLDALIKAGVDARQIYTDKISGSRDSRPGLKACLEYLSPGDTLIVWKLDRLGRSLAHLLTLITDLGARDIAFRSLTEEMNTSTAQGKLLFSVFGALAEFERSLIKERVNAGLAAAAKRGRRGGRPVVVDAEKTEQIVALLNAGASQASICRTSDIARSTLRDTLRRVGWSAGERQKASVIGPKKKAARTA